MTGAKLLHDERQYVDNGGLALNPLPKRDSKIYEGFNPKLGLLWELRKDVQVFADLTRSQDVPDFTDLTQTTAATTRFVPLQSSRAWTVEAGTRGKYDGWRWDITFYRSVLRDELLQFTTDPSIPAATFNAPRTLHQGVELGVSAEVLRNIIGAGDKITLSQLWNFSDFRFQNDPQYGNNKIAGVPDHVLRTVVSYTHPSGFYFAPAVDWVPNGAWADDANRLRAPGYALLGVQTGMQFANGLLIYLDARNLADRRYVSDISTITDATKVGTAVFYPGSGRAIYGGMRYTF
jgi:iron complex outermembrane receptor protein